MNKQKTIFLAITIAVLFIEGSTKASRLRVGYESVTKKRNQVTLWVG